MVGFIQRVQNHKIWTVSKHAFRSPPILQVGKKCPRWAEDYVPTSPGRILHTGGSGSPEELCPSFFKAEKDRDTCQLGLSGHWMGSCWLRQSPAMAVVLSPRGPWSCFSLRWPSFSLGLRDRLLRQQGPMDAFKTYSQMPAWLLHSPASLWHLKLKPIIHSVFIWHLHI